MKRFLAVLFILISQIIQAQIIEKPRGCYAGTNGINSDAMAHSESRGVLITVHWADIETTPNIFDFSSIHSKINLVKNAHLKYTLAISGGSVGSPSWLVETLGADYMDITFRGNPVKLPLWWDSLVMDRLERLSIALGDEFNTDSSLSHIYVTQMTANGVEGHLNGVDMNAFKNKGYSDQKWIDAAKQTTYFFADAFPKIPIVFEVHEIDYDTVVPATIMNSLYQDSNLCQRVGLGMWWISGKTSYQPNLVQFIQEFPGDKYAQIIGRSDQTYRFQDSVYSSVFDQAKLLGIRYIEPWPYEFQHHTHDSLVQNFNHWADANFSPSDSCISGLFTNLLAKPKTSIDMYPNPTTGVLHISLGQTNKECLITIYNVQGQEISTIQNKTSINLYYLEPGTYIIRLITDGFEIRKRIVKQ